MDFFGWLALEAVGMIAAFAAGYLLGYARALTMDGRLAKALALAAGGSRRGGREEAQA